MSSSEGMSRPGETPPMNGRYVSRRVPAGFAPCPRDCELEGFRHLHIATTDQGQVLPDPGRRFAKGSESRRLLPYIVLAFALLGWACGNVLSGIAGAARLFGW